MVIKVGINGFGRIGRVIFRTCHQNRDIELSAINDPAIDVDYICYLIKFDSTHGKFNGVVTKCDNEIKVDDHPIKIFKEKLPMNIPWRDAGVQYVIEASGMFTTLEKATGHLYSESVKRVFVTAPSIDVPMIIMGINDTSLSLDHKIISCASSTLYCLAPIVKVLEDNFGIEDGFMTSIHAMTPSLKPLDGLCLRGKHWRDHRSIHQNIIPASTGACKALGKIIPGVKDKISGLAFRIPIVNVSVLDLTIRLRTNTRIQDIVKCITTASNKDMKNILKISNEESVSSDFIGDNHSCILDVNSSLQLKPNFFKLICWYENEYSYACRVIDSIFFSDRQFSLISPSSKISNLTTKPCTKIIEGKQLEAHNKKMIIANSFNAKKELVAVNVTSQQTNLTNKPQYRSLVFEKPLSSLNSKNPLPSNTRDSKKRNEIFKIRNETNDNTPKPNVRQNRGSFFHSCVSFPHANLEPKDLIKTQERLQSVKREFSKMANITEDLLRKSNSYKNEPSPTNNTKDIYKTIEKNVERQVTENDNKGKNNPKFDFCGDYENKIEISTEKIISLDNKEELHTSHSHENAMQDIVTVINSIDTPFQPENELNSKPNSYLTDDLSVHANNVCEENVNDTKIIENHIEFKEQVAKAINTLIDGLAQKFQTDKEIDEQDDTPNSSSDTGDNEIIKIIKDVESDVDITIKSNTQYFGDNSNNSVNSLNLESEKTNDVDLESVNKKEKASYELKHILKEDNKFKNPNNLFVSNIRNESKLKDSIESHSVRNENNITIKVKNEKDRVSKQILKSLNRLIPDPVFIVPEDNPKNNTIYNKMIYNYYDNQNKLDIYDKLDSASASCSENSFEVNSRKSQIIDIADLTNSIEDLAQLEKICKIIEISDELSDKLFSTLEKKDCHEIKKKKWSFRDLCERIQLDEFCNNVFGKTVF